MKSYSRAKYNRNYVGIGGWKCNCCAPPKSHIKLIKRMIKRREERAEMKIELQEMENKMKLEDRMAYLSKHEVVVDIDVYDKLMSDNIKMDFIRKHRVTLNPETTFWYDINSVKYQPDYQVAIDSIAFFGQNLDDALNLAIANECQHCGKLYDHLVGCPNDDSGIVLAVV